MFLVYNLNCNGVTRRDRHSGKITILQWHTLNHPTRTPVLSHIHSPTSTISYLYCIVAIFGCILLSGWHIHVVDILAACRTQKTQKQDLRSMAILIFSQDGQYHAFALLNCPNNNCAGFIPDDNSIVAHKQCRAVCTILICCLEHTSILFWHYIQYTRAHLCLLKLTACLMQMAQWKIDKRQIKLYIISRFLYRSWNKTDNE